MKKLTEEVLREAVSLINQLRSGLLNDDELSCVVERLDELLLDPHWYDYTIDQEPELSAEKVVERAFSYRPILL
jgi:hypothetical protein